MQAKITTTYEVDGKSAVSALEVITGAGEYTRDLDVPAGETVTFPLVIEQAITESILIVPGQPSTLKLGTTQFQRAAGHPLIWTKGSALPYPVTGDTTEIVITNHGTVDEVVRVRIVELAKSREAVSEGEAPAEPQFTPGRIMLGS